MDARLNASYEQVYRPQEVCVSRPMCNGLFLSCCDMFYHLLQYWTLVFLATNNKRTKLRKYAFPDPCLLNFVFFLFWWLLLPRKIIEHLFFNNSYNPSKTATFVPEITVDDLPLGRTATLVPAFAVKDLPLGRIL